MDFGRRRIQLHWWNELLSLLLFFATAVASAALLPCHEAVKCDSAEPASFFTLGAPLKFTATASIAKGLYQVLNYRDEVVGRGEYSSGKILLAPLPLGYYRLKVEAPCR